MSRSKKLKEGEEPRDPAEVLTNAMLQQMVEELQQTKVSLMLNIKDLQEKLEQQRRDHEDIYYYLNKKCDDNFEVISQLEEQILTEQNAREAAEKGYEKRIEEMKQKFGFEEVKYQSRIAELEDKNQSLKDFGERRDEMELSLSKLMTTLEEERAQYKKITADLENKSIFDKEMLRKEFERRLASEKAEVLSSIDDRLPAKAKKAHQDYLRIRTEMKLQSKQADQLLEVTKMSFDKEQEMKRELELSKSCNEEMINRLAMYQSTIRDLNRKLEESERVRTDEHRQIEELKRQKESLAQEMSEDVGRRYNRAAVEDQLMDEMWSTLRRAYEIQKKQKSRIYQRPDHTRKGDLVIDERQSILIALLQEAIKKFPEKFPMSMFFEAGVIDQYRRSLSQQSTWSALKLSTKFPAIGQKSNQEINELNRSAFKQSESRSVFVQTDDPPGSSDVRFVSSRPSSTVSRASTSASSNQIVLGVVGSTTTNSDKRRSQVNADTRVEGSLPHTDYDDDATIGTVGQSVDSLTVSDQHSTTADTESYLFDGGSSIQSVDGEATVEDERSRDSKSTTTGYLPFISSPKAGGISAKFNSRVKNPRFQHPASSSTSTTLHALAVNQSAFHSRMAELEAWREQRMSRDKSKAKEAAAAMAFVGSNGLVARSSSNHVNDSFLTFGNADGGASSGWSQLGASSASYRKPSSKRKGKSRSNGQPQVSNDDVSLGSLSLASTL